MVVGENQQAIVFENAPALAEDVPQLGGEVVGVRVLDLQGLRVVVPWPGELGRRLLPGVEEIGELRVMDVVEEGRIGDDQVDALGGQACGRGVAA